MMVNSLKSMLRKEEIKSMGFSLAQVFRASSYLSQSVLSSLILDRKPSAAQAKELADPKLVLTRLWELFRLDAENIKNGLYLAPAKWIESPLDFIKTSARGILDLFKVKRREARGSVQEVPQDPQFLALPKYYRQNFHFQTDGWLSDYSAQLYDHQVEVVFGGGAAAMRRQALPMIKSFLDTSSIPSHEVKILDLASGTGTFALELKRNFPDASLTVNDLSPFYLKKARNKLADTVGTDFIQANAEELPVKDQLFDVVTCVFLFHELPARIRTKVVDEAHRVLKPGGLFVLVDSIQIDDVPEFNGSLRYFPEHYHEPYYLNYIEQPYAQYIPAEKWQPVDTTIALFSKISAFKKL